LLWAKRELLFFKRIASKGLCVCVGLLAQWPYPKPSRYSLSQVQGWSEGGQQLVLFCFVLFRFHQLEGRHAEKDEKFINGVGRFKYQWVQHEAVESMLCEGQDEHGVAIRQNSVGRQHINNFTPDERFTCSGCGYT
jgi:hypothetical protein